MSVVINHRDKRAQNDLLLKHYEVAYANRQGQINSSLSYRPIFKLTFFVITTLYRSSKAVICIRWCVI